MKTIEELVDDMDDGTQLCVRILSTLAGGLMQEFGTKRVFDAIDILSHPDSQAVFGTMVARSGPLIEKSADEVVEAYQRAREAREQEGDG